jgi:hypothetical protein
MRNCSQRCRSSPGVGGVLRDRRAIGRRARIAGDRGGRFGFLAIEML